MDPQKRSTLKTIGAVGLGYAAFRYIPKILPEKIDLEPLKHPAGFRKYAAGKSSFGNLDLFIGLQTNGGKAQREAEEQADRRVAKDICNVLFGGVKLGAGQVPIASFSDYYCPLCRIQTKELAEFAQLKGGAIAVVWHELPIFGERSIHAAKAALAAKRQGAYVEFHNRLMTTPFVASEKYLSDLSSDLNLNGNQLRADMNSASVLRELENSAALSRHFALVGTPAMVIGRTVVQGRISKKMLQKIVSLERKEGWAETCG